MSLTKRMQHQIERRSIPYEIKMLSRQLRLFASQGSQPTWADSLRKAADELERQALKIDALDDELCNYVDADS